MGPLYFHSGMPLTFPGHFAPWSSRVHTPLQLSGIFHPNTQTSCQPTAPILTKQHLSGAGAWTLGFSILQKPSPSSPRCPPPHNSARTPLALMLLKECLTFQLFQKALPDWPLQPHPSPGQRIPSLLLRAENKDTRPCLSFYNRRPPQTAQDVHVFLAVCKGIYHLLYLWP